MNKEVFELELLVIVWYYVCLVVIQSVTFLLKTIVVLLFMLNDFLLHLTDICCGWEVKYMHEVRT